MPKRFSKRGITVVVEGLAENGLLEPPAAQPQPETRRVEAPPLRPSAAAWPLRKLRLVLARLHP